MNRNILKITSCVLFAVLVFLNLHSYPACASAVEDSQVDNVKWLNLTDSNIEKRGLPWFRENGPKLYRLPLSAQDKTREKLWQWAKYPAGARIRFKTNSSQLWIRLEVAPLTTFKYNSQAGTGGLDVYVNGAYWCSTIADEEGVIERVFFEGVGKKEKDITIYLPLFQEVSVLSIGVDNCAKIKPSGSFTCQKPIVFYGSSICQGSCASRPAMCYPAIVARKLNLDYINLGFAGNGLAEPEVVELINQIDACCFVFDLGKSFNKQKNQFEIYTSMLEKIRSLHPEVPLICITPIFSTREEFNENIAKVSKDLRDLMNKAVNNRIEEGDKRIILVNGLDLLGSGDNDKFAEGVHPTDLGFQQIADKLTPIIQKALPKIEQFLR